jgi:hypothetical protein
MKYYLGSSAAGDVVSQDVLPLVTRAPLNASLPNLDSDRDNKVGLKLKNDGTFVLGNPDKIQRFRLDPAATLELNGSVDLLLYAAAKDLKADDVEAAAALVSCPDTAGPCTVFATDTVAFVGAIGRFSPITFDFGSQNRAIPTSQNLEIWIIDTKVSKHDMWIAYDTTGLRSVLTLSP